MSQAGINSLAILPPGTGIVTITGNTGGAVGPDISNNINVVGDNTTIKIAGNPGTNTLTVSSTGIFYQYVNVNTTPYTVLTDDIYISVDSSTIPITILLPNSALLGSPYIVKDRTGNAAVNNITITTVGGVVDIDGSTTFVMDNDFQATSILGNGTNYELY